MTTWTATTPDTSTWDGTSFVSQENGYVQFGYVTDGYITGVPVWVATTPNTTTWTVA